MANRRISYYTLSLSRNDNGLTVEHVLTTLLSYINGLANQLRKQDMGDERFCFLYSQDYDQRSNISRVIFKSARHSYRAPLIHRDTLAERDNPKLIEEGELFRTHLVIKQGRDESIAILEVGLNTISMKAIVAYLNLFLRRYDNSNPHAPLQAQLEFNIIPSDDFGMALQQMTRVKGATVTFHKNILGSEALGFSQQMNDIQEDVEVVVKAKRGLSIQNHILSTLARLNGGRSQITKIRVKGIIDGVESIIDTSVMVKRSFIDVPKNDETGEFSSPDMLQQMVVVVRDL